MKQTILTTAFCLFALVSCESLNLERADDDVPVVESYIHPGQDVIVKIKKQFIYNSSDTATIYLNDLDVIIKDTESIYTLNNIAMGQYANADLKLNENHEYTLEFTYNDKLVSAITHTPSKPEGFSISASTIEVFSFDNFSPGSGSPERPEPVEITYENPDDDYHIIVVECTESSPVLINSATDRPLRTFRSLPVQGTYQELDPMQFTYYGKHRLILYRLNPEYATLYEQMETTSLDIEAPPSNVENGLGIFTGINSDTIFVKVVSQ